MIEDINSKTKQEREKLNKIVQEAQTELEGATQFDQRRKKYENTKRDAAFFSKLNTLQSDIDKF